MACRERWLDVFVTKPDTGIDKQSYEYDDQFACTVQSVRFDPTDTTKAMVVDDATDWVLPTWTASYNQQSYKGGVYDKVEVGDLVRVGATGTNGHTDYLTVMEKRTVSTLYNQLESPGASNYLPLSMTSTTDGVGQFTTHAAVATAATVLTIAPAFHNFVHQAVNSSAGTYTWTTRAAPGETPEVGFWVTWKGLTNALQLTSVVAHSYPSGAGWNVGFPAGGTEFVHQVNKTVDSVSGRVLTLTDGGFSKIEAGDLVGGTGIVGTVASGIHYFAEVESFDSSAKTITLKASSLSSDPTSANGDTISIYPKMVFTHDLNWAEGAYMSGDGISGSVTGTVSRNKVTISGATTGLGEVVTIGSRLTAASMTVGTAGIAHVALRLNQSVNCTAMPVQYPKDANATHPYDADGTHDHAVTIATRDQATVALGNATSEDEKFFYPLYVHKKWLAGSTLRAALDHGVKQCSCIKLVGYSVANKRQVGLHHAHEMQADDYLVVRINEIEGHVVSNNRHASGAFAVLYSGSSADNQVGAVEYNQFDTVNGIVVQDLDATNSVLRNLTLEITDRRGNPAHFGRMHLWFKLLVTHG